MANNTAANSAFRRIASAVRGIPEQFGARNTLVTIRVRTYTGPVGGAGVTSTAVDTVLSPIPRVNQVSEGRGGYFGGGILTDDQGRVLAGEYEIGPITQEFPGGGYAPTTLAPAGGVTKRVTVLLAGDEFQSGGEEFEILRMDATRPFRTMLLVSRVRQGA